MLKARDILALVVIAACVVILITLVVHVTYGGGCNPGPKPISWTVHQYQVYLQTACN